VLLRVPRDKKTLDRPKAHSSIPLSAFKQKNQSNTQVRSICDNKNPLIVDQKGEKMGKKPSKTVKKAKKFPLKPPLRAPQSRFFHPKKVPHVTIKSPLTPGNSPTNLPRFHFSKIKNTPKKNRENMNITVFSLF